MRSSLIIAVALCCLASAQATTAQIPERFENLKVLPADISLDSLLVIMRSFSFGLDARCVYCHVGEDTPTLANVDFKSDEKAAKRTAREMLRMVGTINQAIGGVPELGAAPLQVRCATCHRGISRPIPLQDSIYTIVGARGGDAAVIAYDSLRTTYFGRAAFDFGAQTLVLVAERLRIDGRHVDAVAILRRNAEAHPGFWRTYYELGRNYEALNRREDAIAAYRATLERLPGHSGSTARLQALGAGGS